MSRLPALLILMLLSGQATADEYRSYPYGGLFFSNYLGPSLSFGHWLHPSRINSYGTDGMYVDLQVSDRGQILDVGMLGLHESGFTAIGLSVMHIRRQGDYSLYPGLSMTVVPVTLIPSFRLGVYLKTNSGNTIPPLLFLVQIGLGA